MFAWHKGHPELRILVDFISPGLQIFLKLHNAASREIVSFCCMIPKGFVSVRLIENIHKRLAVSKFALSCGQSETSGNGNKQRKSRWGYTCQDRM